jgi:hypothetical protein
LKYFPVALLLSIGIGIGILAKFNQMWEGGADNYWHYYFSRYAYSKPEFFLHHWGKPIFIFLSAPFSQFGFYGLIGFNILCSLFATYICFLFVNRLGFKASWMVIPIAVFAPVYFYVMQSAMTECLFSLLFVGSAYLLFKEKFMWGAIVASFLIYSRSEGMFFLIIFAFYMAIARQWKYIPLLATAFLIYSFAGYFYGDDFLWFFTKNPYAEESGYGHGTWSHFFVKYNYIFGLPHVILLCMGLVLIGATIIINKEWDFRNGIKPNMKVLILVVIPFVLFFAFHMYAWAKGKYASAGLERVFTCVIPASAIICMYPLHFLQQLIKNNWLRQGLNILVCFFIVKAAFRNYDFPLKAWGPEKTSRIAAQWFKKIRKPGKQVYYCHPATIFFCDYNPFAENIKECMYFQKTCPFGKEVKPFYYIWDSFFTPTSCYVKLEDYKNCKDLILLKEFDNHENFHIAIFEYTPN